MNKPNKNTSINIALFGFGMWGKNLARNLSELGVLRLICEPNPKQAQEARQKYPDVEVCLHPEKVLKRKDIHAVVIATPAATHFELALKALYAGKDVFVEKPLALSVAEGEKLVNEAKRRERILLVGHVLEYHPAVRKLCQLVKEGELGQIYYLYSNRLNWGRIRTEENALWSFAPHDVAIMLRLLGNMPEKVTCQGGAYLNKKIADVTLMSLTFPQDIRAHIFVSWLHPFKEQRFVVVGSKQLAVFDDTQPWDRKLILYPHKVDWIQGQVPLARKAESVPVPLEEAEPLRLECEHFIECVIHRKQPLTDGESAIKVLKVLEEAQRSMNIMNDSSCVFFQDKLKKNFYIHPTAIVDEGAEIGEGTKIWHFSHVMPGAKIGKNCVLGQNVFVGKNVRIGNGVKIQNNVSVYEGVTLEDYVFCGPSVVFTNVINPRSEIERKSEFRSTLVKKGATLGANSTILCGITIGKYAFVGAGAVVTKNVPDYALVVGVPARIVGWVCECGEKLHFDNNRAVCSACGKTYLKKGERVERDESTSL